MTHSTATGQGGEDAAARGKYVDEVAVVGEGRSTVGRRSCANSAGRRSGRGRVVVGVVVAVSRGNGEEDVVGHQGGGRAVHGRRVGTADRHVDNDAPGAVPLTGVSGNKIHTCRGLAKPAWPIVVRCFSQPSRRVGATVLTGNDGRPGSFTTSCQDLDSIQPGIEGNAVRVASNGAGDVSAMAMLIRVGATGKVGHHGSAVAEFLHPSQGERLDATDRSPVWLTWCPTSMPVSRT